MMCLKLSSVFLRLTLLFFFCSIAEGVQIHLNNNACDNYAAYPFWFLSKHCNYNANVLSNTPSMISRAGYSSEGHIITTDDGYILTLYRIPTTNPKRNHQPVYIQHGIMTNSAVWVDMGNKSLAFYLSNLGYDVWLGNIRASAYSRQHKTFKTSDPKYWNYNLDTIVKYDITASIHYISNVTGKGGQIIYIGHSMGTTLGLMYAINEEESGQKLVKGIIALAPVVYLDNVTELEPLLKAVPTGERVLRALHVGGVFYDQNLPQLLNFVCTSVPFVCEKIISIFFGKMTGQFLPEYLLLFYSYWPDGVAIQQLLHYKQIAETSQFRRYDYGKSGNWAVYGQSQPNAYNLCKIKVPVFLYYGQNDPLTSEQNVKRIYNELCTTTKVLQAVPKNNEKYKFNHVNFLYAKDIDKFLYKEILYDVLTKYLKM